MAAATVYLFVPCCDPTATPIQFNSHGTFLPTVPGVYNYTGVPQFGLENGVCYTVTSVSVINPNPALPFIPPTSNFQYISAGCEDAQCLCGDQCFQLTSCNGVLIYSDSDLILYVNQFVSLVEYPGECFYVEQLPAGGCGTSPLKVNVDGDIPCSCDCTCYIITGTGAVSYVECGGENLTAYAPAQICSISYPEVTSGVGTIEIFENGLCDDITGCPEKCFLLTNCDPAITETITSNTYTLLPYALNNQIITLVGYEGCWIVEETQDCECAVAVTVIQNFSSCETCSPPPAYKLVNCDNSAQIIYTYDDLAVYIGLVVTLQDCVGCWKVELIDYVPPSIQTAVVLTSFTTCYECSLTYYELTDCTGVKDPIYTSADLAQYVGSVVQLQFCPDTCWSVQSTDSPIDPGNVYVEQDFIDCPECYLAIFTCSCKTITYKGQGVSKITYIDCTGHEIDINIFSGETTSKTCMLVAAIDPADTNYEIIDYGLCIDGECPVIPLGPLRQIKPGYSVPACNTERYEKITCKSSEILYKIVMQKRYGLSNCCPDEDDKWLIKKELTDLQGLIDPDYTCTAMTSCCNQPISTCGCSCSGKPIVTTCNS